MDLTPLYDLRDRLKAGAIAGTGLIAEDFRLTRALETLAPLEGASPVFSKIGLGVRDLLAPDCPDRAAALLDALALCDAVITTQSAVAVSGAVEPLNLTARGAALTNAPHSVLAPLMEALTTSGGGRYSFVVDTHDQWPALFQDYRVKNALVSALGAAYSELADRAEEWLVQEGAEIVPILKSGFDPVGKKEMVRRLHVIEAVAGAEENDFYIGLLDTAEKEVRGAAVFALHHDVGNVERLITLAKTERGAVKKQAHWALSRLDTQTAWDYWHTLVEKKPEQAVEYMILSAAPQAGALIAGALDATVTPLTGGRTAITKETHNRLQQLLSALPGKSGPEICGFYRRAAALGTDLDRPMEGEKTASRFTCLPSHYSVDRQPFSGILPRLLLRALQLYPAGDLLRLAEELHVTYGSAWRAPAVLAALLSKTPEEGYVLAQPILKQSISIFKKKEQKEDFTALQSILQSICWNKDAHRQETQVSFFDPALDGYRVVTQPLAAPLERRWYEDLRHLHSDFPDAGYIDLVIPLIQPENRELCDYLGYFFYYALPIKQPWNYLDAMCACGWPKCEGLAVRFADSKMGNSVWQLKRFIERMPGNNMDKALEVDRVIRMMEQGASHFQSAGIPELRQLAQELRNPNPISH